MTVNSYDAMDGLPVIVDEFERFIKFVEEQKPKLSSKKLHLGKKDTFALNLLLQNKRAVRGPHYTQEQYPMIDLLYFLALDGELYVIGNDHKGSIVFTKTPRLEEYMELNIYEKYIFTFKVSLAHNKKKWRKIRLSHQHYLDRLHKAIQKAFESEDDHLYAFCFGSSSFKDGKLIYCPYVDDYEFTTLDYTIGDLGLVKGQRFYYLFDFVDSLWFEIYVAGIDKDSILPSDYEILAQKNNKQ